MEQVDGDILGYGLSLIDRYPKAVSVGIAFGDFHGQPVAVASGCEIYFTDGSALPRRAVYDGTPEEVYERVVLASVRAVQLAQDELEAALAEID